MSLTNKFNSSSSWDHVIQFLIDVSSGKKQLADFDFSSIFQLFFADNKSDSETSVAAKASAENTSLPQQTQSAQTQSTRRASAETATNFNPAQTQLVVWGDSIANGMGQVASKMGISKVMNLGVDGAGFYSGTKPAAVPKIEQNAKFLVHFGTNDIAVLIGKSDEEIAKYAARVMSVAKSAAAHGASVTILGINNADKRDENGNLVGYRGGDQRFWGNPENVRKWNETAERLNAAYEKQAKAAGFGYKATNDDVKPEMLSADGLHPNARGAQTMLGLGTGARA